MSQLFQQISQQFNRLSIEQINRVSQNSFSFVSQNSFQNKLAILESFRMSIDRNNNFLQQILSKLNEFMSYIKYNKKWEIEYQYCVIFKKTILIRLEQNFMIIRISQNQKNQKIMNQLQQIYKDLEGFNIPIHKNTKLNNQMIDQILDKQKQYYELFQILIQKMLNQLNANLFEQCKANIIQIKSVHSKIYTIAQIFPSAAIFPADDLLNFTTTIDQRWQSLKNIIKFKTYGNQRIVLQSFQSLKQHIILANAAMRIINEKQKINLNNQDDNFGLLKKGISLIQLLFLKQKAKEQAQYLISDPNEKLTKQIWNMTDVGITSQMLKFVFPKINYSNQIYIPREFNLINLETINKMLTDKQFVEQQIKKLSMIEVENIIKHKNQYRNKLYTKNINRICIRINSPQEIQKKIHVQQTFIQKMALYFKEKKQVFEKIIFHIHGGGFISMSSYSHQIYTRKWANQLNTPIFSVDYAKAPQHPYPQGLNDCLQAYIWLLYILQQIYQIKVKKIVIVGDSAGGNLVASLMNLIVQLKLRIPDGIFLIYPALNLNDKAYTPSLLNTLDDFILPHTYLKICTKAYIPKSQYLNIDSDYYLSPIKTPQQILSKYPIVRIYVGSKDPFYDDCLRFTEILKNEKKNVKTVIFVSFSHGFLQFDNFLQPILQARNAIDTIRVQIKEILQ